MITLKFIKKTAFKVGTVDHTHYTTAYAGRVIAVSTLNIDATNITADASSVKVSGDVELVNRSWVDPMTSESRVGLVLLPKLDIAISQF